MRLLNVNSFELVEFRTDDARPRYAIASHRWSRSETTFKDVQKRRNRESVGYKKVEAFARYIRDHLPSIDWLWIDTCCINKDSSSELSQAINLMFEWYRNAELCLAYLADVETAECDIARSEWFTRGWTLQELLAPRVVLFLTQAWQVIGNKGGVRRSYSMCPVGPGLEERIARITAIPEKALLDFKASSGFSVEDKLKWLHNRRTTEEEDMSYCLYGIFGVSPGVNYGERHSGARYRLLAAINQQQNVAKQKSDEFREIVAWISPPDPWTNHESARQQREAQTGQWLLRDSQYSLWKVGALGTSHVWMYGKAGCGKTILCATIIDDMQRHCAAKMNAGLAFFYFSFSDDQKQTYENLLRSLIAQLGWREPGLSMLRKAYLNGDRPEVNKFERVLMAIAKTYDTLFLILDALDECPERDDVRQNVLERIEELARCSPNLKILAISRELRDIRESMDTLPAMRLAISTPAVNVDIERYVANQLSRDRRLLRLDEESKAAIKTTIAQKAGGMFRWAYCQIQEFKKLKSLRPSYIRNALHGLPVTLDDTYTRMLTNIEEVYRKDALVLLRWLAYAQSPPTLAELIDSLVIDLAKDTVDISDRGDLETAINILSGLVIVVRAQRSPKHDEDTWTIEYDHLEGYGGGFYHDRMGRDTRVRLAHFSIKEYLESERIQDSCADGFHLIPTREHRILADSCLVYLIFYSRSYAKTSAEQDLNALPLLGYAAHSWFYHSARSPQQRNIIKRDILLLTSEEIKRDWILMSNVRTQSDELFARYDSGLHYARMESIEPFTQCDSSLYYASLLGLEAVAATLLERGEDANAEGGRWGNALNAAAVHGHEKIVKVLLEGGADVDAQNGAALWNASSHGYVGVVRHLVEAGADLHQTSAVASGKEEGEFEGALYGASYHGHQEVVQLLLEAGADPNRLGGTYRSALTAALTAGNMDVTRLLLEAGAQVNTENWDYQNALYAAAWCNDERAVQMMVERGADAAKALGEYGTALQVAVQFSNESIVQMLIDGGTDVNAHHGHYGTPLSIALSRGSESIVRMLVDGGADINVEQSRYGGALNTASSLGYEKIVRILIDRGADIDTIQDDYGNALHIASSHGHESVVQVILEGDRANLEARTNKGDSALQLASSAGHESTVQMLINAGADLDYRHDGCGDALCEAASRGHERIVQMLIEGGANVHAQTNDGLSVRQAAFRGGHKRIVQMLIEAGGDVKPSKRRKVSDDA